LRRHAATAAGPARTAIAAAEAAAITATAAETVTTAPAAPVIATAEPRWTALCKRIEALFPETVPFVASPAATTFIGTHEPN
jgi:hypothetical protein